MNRSSQKIAPGPGQESVWDYPRPPRLESSSRRIRVVFNGETIADTTKAYRVLETSHPPVWYIPKADICAGALQQTSKSSFCEFKGNATYWTIEAGGRSAKDAAWSYESPTTAFEPITGHVAIYANKVDECYVDDERVEPQPGDFYGGWVTREVVGPFKGGPGTWGW